jgi:hypothetical protein
MSTPQRFRFNAKNVFLTYPQCGDLSKERLRDFLVESLGCRWYHIGRESHVDGGYHLHAYAGWERKRDLRGADCFDCDGQHPNITIPRDAKAVAEYCGKNGDILSNVEIRDLPGRTGTTTGAWLELLNAPTKRAFMDGASKLDPRGFVYQLERLEYFCEKRYGMESGAYEGRGREEFVEPDELAEWVTENYEVRRPGGAPAPSLLVHISSHAYLKNSGPALREVNPCAWWETLEGGRLSGRDLLALPSTCADSSISTTGRTVTTPSYWTTSISPSSLTGSASLGRRNASTLPTSTERNEESQESSLFGFATMDASLASLFPELNWNGITLT